MRKTISILLAILILCLLLSSCRSQDTVTYPLTVNGTPIDSEIFSYYLDSAWDDGASGGTKDGRITEASHMCIRYVAVNSTFTTSGLSLSDSEKVEISDNANVLWELFGEYYKKIGVSKQTYLKIKTNEAYIEKLRTAFFDVGGTDEISDAVLRGVLLENYVSFRYIRTPLTDVDVYGNERPLDENETAQLNTLYNKAVSSVKASLNIDKAYSDIAAVFPLTERTYETKVIDRYDHEFSLSVFNTVKEMEDDAVKIFQYGDYVYLIEKINIINDGAIFADLRRECLKLISEEPLQSKINIMCNAYQSVRDTALVKKIYEKVAENR